MNELILHADDYGRSVGHTDCIVDCFNRGWISETSLMVNMPDMDRAVSIARQKGFSHRVGLHLNLTGGVPLTEKIRICPCFCDADGCFNKVFHHRLKTRFFLSAREQAAVREEIEAQLQKFSDYKGLMKKVDSHHHAHTDWAVYRILRALTGRYGITGMRLTATLHRVSLGQGVYKRWLNADIRRRYACTDEFDSFCPSALQAARAGRSVEVMVHPLYSESGEILDQSRRYLPLIERMVKFGLSARDWRKS